MKTDHSRPSVDQPHPSATTPLDELLGRRISGGAHASASEKINGVLVGALHALDADGNPQVSISVFGDEALVARSLVAVTADDLGRQVALGFEAGDARLPIILGFMHEPASAMKVRAPNLVVETTQGRVLLQSEDELELRCGEAVILLQADGRITLRGQYITSHADAGQRIRGGSVQIN